jgi:hypothetical protein
LSTNATVTAFEEAHFINKVEALHICSFCFIELLNDFAPLCGALFIRSLMATSPGVLPVGFNGGSSRPQLPGCRSDRVLRCTVFGEGLE